MWLIKVYLAILEATVFVAVVIIEVAVVVVLVGVNVVVVPLILVTDHSSGHKIFN